MVNKSSKTRLKLLVLRAQSGDRYAMDSLLESCQSEIFGYLLKMLRNRTDAEDVLQATLMQSVKKLKWLRTPECFRSWIFRIASHHAFRVIKRRQKSRERTNTLFIDETIHAESETVCDEGLIEQIPHWLERLTTRGREAIILHYLEGFTSEEVADILNIPLGTVKSRVSYALTCIRKQIYEGQNI